MYLDSMLCGLGPGKFDRNANFRGVKLPMRFEFRIEKEAIPEWRPKYVKYKALKQILKILPELPPEEFNVFTGAYERGGRDDLPLSESENLFMTRLEKELAKVNEFYASREKEAIRRKQQILLQIRLLTESHTGSFPSVYESIQNTIRTTFQSSTTLPSPPLQKSSNDPLGEFKKPRFSSAAKSAIKKALLEYYRSLELLTKYKSLNYLAFGKIMKKFDKKTHRLMSAKFMETVKQSPFYASSISDSLMTGVENIYRRVFTGGDRSKALRKLRTPDMKYKSYQGWATISGILGGLMITLAFAIGNILLRSNTEKQVLALIYGGLGLPILMASLFSLNMYVWESFHINYRFIFGFDHHSVLHNSEYNAFIGAIALFYLGFVYLSLNGNLDTIMPNLFHQPWILIITLCIMVLLPLPIFFWQSRYWLAKVIGRIVTSPLYSVCFKDFFINDQLMSLGFALQMFAYVVYMCDMNRRNGEIIAMKASIPPHWLIFIIPALPAFWRVMQSLRRFWDSGKVFFPHMANLMKYLISFMIPFASFGVSLNASFHWVKFVLLLAGSIYSYAWDIFMDFGLMQKGPINFMLRETIMFPLSPIYYALMVINFACRFLWIVPFFNLLPANISPLLSAYIFAVVEVVRRSIWNIFRVEYEHVNNCNSFRAFADIALPFATKDLFYQDMVEVEIANHEKEVDEEQTCEAVAVMEKEKKTKEVPREIEDSSSSSSNEDDEHELVSRSILEDATDELVEIGDGDQSFV